MNAILVTGYRGFELSIFQDKDPRIDVIKAAIRKDLIHYLEEGVEWFIFTGNLGFEYWALQVAKKLQADYPFQIATLFTFETQGQQWNEANQANLADFKQVDFVTYAYESYENPSQFRQYNHFLVQNTQGAYLFYDTENETQLKYLLKVMQEQADYPITFLTFERLNEFLEDW